MGKERKKERGQIKDKQRKVNYLWGKKRMKVGKQTNQMSILKLVTK